ncbi:hypothetical protein BDZ90DRAFT_260890 [Jaminaea rosea]|uniref:Uncharacterized protein n=1 Tax=Jaminaea rosea TaxID=1569628 RepID=A0A316UPK3_9BASI|nr:hypothetical protein BDZ90DRAFT_260890 [Jaminaea rosea]PWN27232.1 hypothetical protein BDZ90DRAFT_260890 [Jaminaea rosea]
MKLSNLTLFVAVAMAGTAVAMPAHLDARGGKQDHPKDVAHPKHPDHPKHPAKGDHPKHPKHPAKGDHPKPAPKHPKSKHPKKQPSKDPHPTKGKGEPHPHPKPHPHPHPHPHPSPVTPTPPGPTDPVPTPPVKKDPPTAGTLSYIEADGDKVAQLLDDDDESINGDPNFDYSNVHTVDEAQAWSLNDKKELMSSRGRILATSGGFIGTFGAANPDLQDPSVATFKCATNQASDETTAILDCVAATDVNSVDTFFICNNGGLEGDSEVCENRFGGTQTTFTQFTLTKA